MKKPWLAGAQVSDLTMAGAPTLELDDPESPADPLAWLAQYEVDELKARACCQISGG